MFNLAGGVVVAYFPLFVSLEGKQCLVVGGGKVAFRKAKVMVEYGADVLVVAEEFCKEMEEGLEAWRNSEPKERGKEEKGKDQRRENPWGQGAGRIRGVKRRAVVEDAEGMDLVLCASSDETFHGEMASYCRKHRIWVNVADNKEESEFLFPALVRQGDLVLGITTGGNSPAASRYLRETLEKDLMPGMGKLVDRLGKLRPVVKAMVPQQRLREEVFSRLFLLGMEKGGEIGEEDVFRVMGEVNEMDRKITG